ncbi:MAG: hypothetical protein WCH44_13985 [Betaproteobacteria bacterium]
MLLTIKGWLESSAVASGARVLRQRRTPENLWRAWLRAALGNTMFLWGLIGIGATLLLALPTSPWPWSSAAGFFSTLLSLSYIAALSNHGVLHRAWLWVILTGCLLLAVWVSVIPGLAHGADQFSQSPVILQTLLALSWPMLAYVLVTRWQRAPALRVIVYGNRQGSLWERISAVGLRYTALDNSKLYEARRTLTRRSPFAFLRDAIFQFLWIPTLASPYLLAPWNSEIGPAHLLVLAFFSASASGALICKGLHWRHLLAPGNWHRGRLGWHIFVTSVALQWAVIAFVVCIWAMGSWAFADVPLSHSLETTWSYRILALEMAAATGFALIIRGLGRLFPVIFLFAFVALWCAGLWIFGFSHWPTWFEVDADYGAALLIASLASVAVANRLWTVKKLQPFLRLS